MQIVGYYIHGNKHYVAFREDGEQTGKYMITDGFHDRPMTERNKGKYASYQKVDKDAVNLKKIIGHMRGTRPWHPLLKVLRKEAAA